MSYLLMRSDPLGALVRCRWWIVSGLVIVGLALQFTTFLNQDLAWITYSARWLLDGAVYGRDLLDPNPPLAWYLALPEAYLWKSWGIHPGISTPLIVAAMALAVLWYLDRLPRLHGDYFPRRTMAVVLPAIAYWLFFGCADSFGQREYLAALFALPHLLLVPPRYRGLSLSTGAAVAVGLLAGVGYSIKPNFLVVPVLMELVAMVRFRRVGPLLRMENWALGTFAVAYALAVFIFVPAYVSDMLPFIPSYYWAFYRDWDFVVLVVGGYIAILATALYLCTKNGWSDLLLSLVTGAVGFLISYLVQQKGYSYHAFPLKMLAATAVITATFAADKPDKGMQYRLGIPAIAVVCFLSLMQTGSWYRNYNLVNGPRTAETRQLIGILDKYAPQRTFLALTSHPYPAFPTALYTTAIWGSRRDSQHFLPAVARLRAGETASGAADLETTEHAAWDDLREGLRSQPAVVFVYDPRHAVSVEPYDFDILAFYREDPEIDAAFQNFHEIARTENFRVLVRIED